MIAIKNLIRIDRPLIEKYWHGGVVNSPYYPPESVPISDNNNKKYDLRLSFFAAVRTTG